MTDWTPTVALDELRALLPIEDDGPPADFREITGPELHDGDLPIAELVSLAIDKPVALAGVDGTYAGKVAFRGGHTCECVALSLPRIERAMLQRGIIRRSIDVWQLGYRTDVRASAGTHSAGCMVDVGQYSDAALRVWREYGWTMQHRTRAQGFSMDHGHGGPYGCWHGSDYADYQQREYAAGRNGLISRGPVTGPNVPLIRWDTALKERFDEVATVTEIKDNGVTVKNVKTGETFFVECDDVVNGIGFVPTPVGGKDNKQVFRVGDCVAIGNLRTVIWRAWDVCMKI